MNLNNESKTLFLCLKAKSDMSKQGFLIQDKHAEAIMDQMQFDIKQSKYLSMFLTLRSKLIDDAIKPYCHQDCVVLHYGCGLDSRYQRMQVQVDKWYDLDYESVLKLKKQYLKEDDHYEMIACDQQHFIDLLKPASEAILILEGVSMYMDEASLTSLFNQIHQKYQKVFIILDTYSKKAVKFSKYKNPVNQYQAKITYGVDDVDDLLKLHQALKRVRVYPIKTKTNDFIFDHLYCGKTASKMMKIYELKMEE